MGDIKGPEFYQQLYSVDAVHYADELASVLKSLQPSGSPHASREEHRQVGCTPLL